MYPPGVRVSVIGAGSWGTTVAMLAARKNPTVLWARRPELAEAINSTSENREYLSGIRLPYGLTATADLATALAGAEVVVFGVPSHGFRTVVGRLREAVAPDVPVLSLTKGLEQDTLLRMTQIITELMPTHRPELVGVLTGPNLAPEIAAGQPAAAVIGMKDGAAAAALQQLLIDPTFRVYTNADVIGCELAGALKNVMAIAAGMAVGLGFGDNTLATLITRALAELTRLGVTLGGEASTFSGLAGVGDLIATCTSHRSRNHMVGVELAKGRRLDEIVADMKMVAEGVKTTRAVLDLAARHGIDMPIAAQVGRVLYEGEHPRAAVLSLMTRQPRPES